MPDGDAVVAETRPYAGWLSTLDAYGVQFLALDRRRDGKMLRLIRSQPGWAVDFEDQEGVLFVRRGVTGDQSGAVSR
jgi:hypothetical protein